MDGKPGSRIDKDGRLWSGSLQGLVEATKDSKDKFNQNQGGAERWLGKVADSLIRYGRALDVFVQQYPDITSVVWGTVRVLITVQQQPIRPISLRD